MSGGWTPGPWHFRLEAVRTVIYHKAEIGEKAIAVGAGSYPDHVANARLLAAAPDLFEALANLVFVIEALPEKNEARLLLTHIVADANAALSKARSDTNVIPVMKGRGS